ncbi:hypothetical protein V6N13_086803 [Hibiscus sabdariffa]|uniref:Secreted protein n=1 Tax=Hibiscus sabdariffa TaxID=183260 RepID=A0ABR2FUW0_9ROSI
MESFARATWRLRGMRFRVLGTVTICGAQRADLVPSWTRDVRESIIERCSRCGRRPTSICYSPHPSHWSTSLRALSVATFVSPSKFKTCFRSVPKRRKMIV